MSINTAVEGAIWVGGQPGVSNLRAGSRKGKVVEQIHDHKVHGSYNWSI
jgi:hypothetical protein